MPSGAVALVGHFDYYAPVSGYFSKPFAVHLAAFAALALMCLQNMSVLGGTNTLVMMAILTAATLALHGYAWAGRARMSASARSVLVALALLGPLYTLLVFALYAFAASENPLMQAVTIGLTLACLITMGLAFRLS